MTNDSNHWILRHLTRSVKLKQWPGDTKSYLWQPVIASQVIQQRMEESQTNVLAWLGLVSVAYPTLDNVYKSPSAYRTLKSHRFYWNHKCFTWGRFRSSRSSGMHWPSVCHTDEPQSRQNSCLWLFHHAFVGWLGRRSLVAANKTSCPLAMVSVLLTWSVGVISSDYCHLSQLPYTGQCVQIPIYWYMSNLLCSVNVISILRTFCSLDRATSLELWRNEHFSAWRRELSYF